MGKKSDVNRRIAAIVGNSKQRTKKEAPVDTGADNIQFQKWLLYFIKNNSSALLFFYDLF